MENLNELVGYSTEQLLSLGFSINDLLNNDLISKGYYQPSDSME